MPVIATPRSKIEATGRKYTETWYANGWHNWHVVSADGKVIAAGNLCMTKAIAQRAADEAFRKDA